MQKKIEVLQCHPQDELGFNMDLLDIGGGFPGSDNAELKFEEVVSN